MEDLIVNHDVEGIRAHIAKERVNFAEDLLNARLERNVRERGLFIAQLPNETMESAAREHLQFVIELCRIGVVAKSTPVSMLQDMFEISRIGRCERLFTIVEENMAQFKQPPLDNSTQTFILRMCNDLLRRLSRTMETSFCGRILFFLSRYLPLGEKSGLNLFGNFNTQNTTKFDTSESQPIDLMATSTVDEDVEMGEIKENKEQNIPVDHALYSMFWQMQSFFSNPLICHEKEQWAVFQKNTSAVLGVFTSYKLEKAGNDSEEHGKGAKEQSVREQLDESDSYFAKYLTSPKLLQLQLNDSQFRRYFLLQCLIVFQYLTADVKLKQKSPSLSDEQSRFVVESEEKCYKLLRETHPRGNAFADSVKSILCREREWSSWKCQGCPDMEQMADKQPMQLYRKRPRTIFNPSIIDVGSAELTKLWNIEPDLLAACRNKKRKFAPELADFLRDPLDEMDPEQQVEDEYKSVNNPAYQWKASRYLMANCSHYFSNPKEPNLKINTHLENVIYNAAKNMDEFKSELSEREEREARKQVEQSVLQRVKEEEGFASPGPDSELSVETLERLSGLMTDQLSQLVEALNAKFKKEPEEKDSSACLRLLTEWSSQHSYSTRKLRNVLLSAELLSAEIVALLKNQNVDAGRKSGTTSK